jgi:thiol-disulfide isomerase/thioredoxin
MRRLLMASALVGVALLSGCGGDDSSSSSGRDPWPSVEIERLADGASVDTETLVGDVPTVVSVWAVWCKPCREELPGLQELSEARAGTVEVVGVNNGDDPEAALDFLDEIGVTFPMYRDPQGALTSAVKVPVVPATLIVMPDGTIGWWELGEVSRADVEAELDRLAAEA